MTRIISATNPLYPISVTNLSTGELVSKTYYEEKVSVLLKYVHEETKRLYSEQGGRLVEEITNTKKIGSPNSFARQRNYVSGYKDLPVEVRAKSRINELILHKLVSEVVSYARNPNPRKQEPSFSPKINLGGVDKQMASLSYDPETTHLFLEWKCWDSHLLFEFWLPKNILKKNIIKWSLPSVQFEKGRVAFRFSVEEQSSSRSEEPVEIAGLDLGITQPYTMVVLNSRGQRTADYTASKGLVGLSVKRSRLLSNKKHVNRKISIYRQLGLETSVLDKESRYLANKISNLGITIAQKMGSEIAHKLEKHKLNTLVVEDLSWVRGAKYGGRWNHSTQQVAVTHALSRKNIRTKKINPKNTSQTCHKCDEEIVHNTRTRIATCRKCKTKFDRDYNAAINIIKKCPAYTSMIGDNLTTKVEVMVENTLSPTHTITRTPT